MFYRSAQTKQSKSIKVKLPKPNRSKHVKSAKKILDLKRRLNKQRKYFWIYVPCPRHSTLLFLGNTPYGIFFPLLPNQPSMPCIRKKKMHWDYYRQTHAQQRFELSMGNLKKLCKFQLAGHTGLFLALLKIFAIFSKLF